MSGLPFELMLALRYVRPKRTSVSIITLISVVGVMLGVAVLIIVISVMSGFDQQTREKILGFNAHLKVYHRGAPMADYGAVAAIIGSNKLVKGMAPFVAGKVMLETQPKQGGTSVDAPILRGIDPAAEDKISVLSKSIVQGTYDVRGNGLLVGIDFADSLQIHVGDRVAIYSPKNLKKMKDARGSNAEVAVLPEDYVVKGIFDVGYGEFNAQWIITSLGNAQDLYDLETSVHGVLIKLDDPYQASQVKEELSRALGDEYLVRTWMQDSSILLDAIVMEKNVMYYILFFIVIVAAFGITSALITFVIQKTREIGLLKALGASNFQVLSLFLGQSVMVGIMGVVSGYALGMLAVTYRNDFLLLLRRTTGREIFPSSVYNFYELPALIVPMDIAIICGVSLLICVLAGLIPAYIASRLKPVEALRHE